MNYEPWQQLEQLRHDLGCNKSVEAVPMPDGSQQLIVSAPSPIGIPCLASSAAIGPVPPRDFWWGDKKHKLTPQTYWLLVAMWSRDSMAASEFEEAVWGDETTENAIKSAVKRANEFLASIAYPKNLHRENGQIFWE